MRQPHNFRPPSSLFISFWFTETNNRNTLVVFLLFFGGDNGARTRDLLTASQALSQLSYTPMRFIL